MYFCRREMSQNIYYQEILIMKKILIYFLWTLLFITPLVAKNESDYSAKVLGTSENVQNAFPSKSLISLSGVWKFRLDENRQGIKEEWFKTLLPEDIVLPGSCEQRGYGIKNTKHEVGRLTRVIMYEGPAWYQRTIDIPVSWRGKRVELFLERCHWESTTWIDGKQIGMQNSLSVPHIYDLGVIKPGKHILTICIDNTYKIPIGSWAHAITKDTQGNWNGIIGRIELHATDLVWMRGVQLYSKQIKINIGNETGQIVDVQVLRHKFSIPAEGRVIEIPFSEGKKWDEFDPMMRKLKISLCGKSFNDTRTITYAIRDLTTKDKQFVLNGRPVLMRGPVDECVYPLTGYPPMDKDSWLRILRICKSYGFNFMRFHSWCPPEVAFEAGDEMGFFFQIELPLWTMDVPSFGHLPVRDQFIREELNRILDSYGNHPSFALMAMGNESGGALDELVKQGRRRDSRHLYRCEGGKELVNGDYYETGQRGVLGPRTDWDRWSSPFSWIQGGLSQSSPTGPAVPTLAHEVGQWTMYPDLDEVKKYTGTLRAYNFEDYRKSLEAHHMLDLAPKLKEASGKFSVLLYKDEIEASMRTWPYGGFEILEARDYPGQGTAIVGWLDAFWDSKGLITPHEFRRFCAPTVCLMRMPKRIFTSDDLFKGEAEIANYGPKAIFVNPQWVITNEQGQIMAQGKLHERKIETGRVQLLGEVAAPFTKVTTPAKLIVTLKAAGTSNSWNIWVYPNTQPVIPQGIHITYAFNQETRNALAAGEKVLLFSSPKEGLIVRPRNMYAPDSLRYLPVAKPGMNAVPGSFMPVFWNARLFNQIGTLGILCDPTHPALAEFPTDDHSDWQWADLLGKFTAAESFGVAGAPFSTIAGDVTNRSKAILLDDTPAEYRPIIQAIDNYDRNSKLGILFETKVGKGKLLVCAMDLDTDASMRPAARQLMKSLLDYMNCDKFNPVDELSMSLLERILLP